MRRIRVISSMVLVLLLLASCAVLQSMGITSKPYSEMTSQEKVLYALKTYNAQYADYKDMEVRTNLTEGQKQVMRVKKQVLTELWPLIDVAKKSVDAGQPIIPDISAKIGNLINQLISKL